MLSLVLLAILALGALVVISALANRSMALLSEKVEQMLRHVNEMEKRQTQLEQSEHKQQSMLSSARMSALGEMAGGVAHEINTPLGTIQLTAETLIAKVQKDAVDGPSVIKSATFIKDATLRIAKIIKGLRTFARNTSSDPMEPASLAAVVEATLDLCQERFHNHNVALEVLNSLAPDLVVECRATEISQALLNLLINGFDAVHDLPQKWLRLELTETAHHVKITVTDSGLGIPDAVAEKLMQPFFTTKQPGQGMGLSLSISQGIILDHGGTIELDRKCSNTQFVIVLPKNQPRAQSAA